MNDSVPEKGSSAADWDRLIAEYPETIELSVDLGIITEEEADAELARFREGSLDQRQRAVLRERWRQVDALEVNAQIAPDDAAEARRELLTDSTSRGFGEPPW